MRAVFKTLAAVVISAALVTLYLVQFHGLRIERDGSGIRPVFSFYRPEKHMAAIEQNRAVASIENPPQVKPAETQPVVPPEKAPIPKPYWTDFRGPQRDGRYDEMPIV